VGVAYYSWIDTDLVRGGDEHPDFGLLRGSLRGPLAKTYPVSKAVEATMRGIERRARWITYPNWIRPMILVRGVVPFFVEAQLGDGMAELDRLTSEKVARLGDRATAPAGAGGEAAERAGAVR
jgi:hypothetical protein